jgi:hypothetical protein
MTFCCLRRNAALNFSLDYHEFLEYLPVIRKYQELALKHGIRDVFQDNGGKVLQIILTLNLKIVPGRHGNDVFDELSQYELKTLNTELQKNFTSHHHLNSKIIDKYRKVPWLFAVYKDIELQKVYRLDAHALEPIFTKWEQKINLSGKDLNNPKISLKFVVQHGKLIFES